MTSHVHTEVLASAPPRRHDWRVARTSSDIELLKSLDLLAVDEAGAIYAVERVCDEFEVPVPRLRFHARRSMFTGATESPRFLWVERLGESEVARREAERWGPLPLSGAIRLGRKTTLMTVAHELGHHLVHHKDPLNTPNHGSRWIERFDQAAAVIASEVTVAARP